MNRCINCGGTMYISGGNECDCEYPESDSPPNVFKKETKRRE